MPTASEAAEMQGNHPTSSSCEEGGYPVSSSQAGQRQGKKAATGAQQESRIKKDYLTPEPAITRAS